MAEPTYEELKRRVAELEKEVLGRNRTQDTLRQREFAQSKMINNLPGMVFRSRKDKRWIMEFVSEGCFDLTGYTPSDLIEKQTVSYKDLVNPEDRAELRIQIQKALNRKQPYRIMYRIRSASGEEKWVWEHGMGLFSDKDEVVSIEGVIIDITDRERELKMLRESQRILRERIRYILSSEGEPQDFEFLDLVNLERLQQIQDAFAEVTGVASLISDIHGNPITKPSNFSKVCEIARNTDKGLARCIESDRVLGEKARTAMHPLYQKCLGCGFVDASAPIIVAGKHIANWFIGQNNLLGTDREQIRDYARQIGADEEEMLAAFDEMPRMTSQQFNKVLNLLWLFARELSNLTYSNLSLAKNIVERKRSEEILQQSEKSFRDLVENSLVGIFIVHDDQILYQNPEQERLSGSLPRSFDPKNILTENIYPEDVEKYKRFYKTIMAGEVRSLDTDFRFYPLDKTGSKEDLKWVYCRASMFEYQGRPAVLVTMMDMTRAKQLEGLIMAQDKMASLGRVAAGMAHEIRNPLSGINIYLKTLEKIYERGQGLEKVQEILGQLQSASNKIESVVRRVMDFSKPTMPRLVRIDINDPINEALGLAGVTLRKAGITFEKMLTDNLPACMADPQMIEEVVLNLINNAAHALKEHEGEKRIALHSSEKDGQIQVCVSDSGPGVPTELRNKIFDPFFTTKNDSTGIGLSICQRIILDHGGTLEVSSSPLGGAMFTIRLPIEGRTNRNDSVQHIYR